MTQIKDTRAAPAPRLNKILDLLPTAVRAYVKSAAEKAIFSSGVDESISEIRLRVGGASSVTARGRAYPIGITLTAAHMGEIIHALTDGSLYAHAETIRDGYIFSHGIRCGICGRAVVRGGHIDSVCDITSITMRVPHDIPGCAAGVCRLFFSELKASHGLLIYSPPGVGKTTLLRDFILSSSDKYNVAVVDSRGELFLDGVSGSIDYLRGYPKHTAIIHAVRSLCPDLIVCDELFGDDDAAAAIYAYSCGVPLVASAHAGCSAELYARNDIARLYSSHAFGCVVGISRGTHGNAFALETEFCKNER